MQKEWWTTPHSVNELEDIWEEAPPIAELPKRVSDFQKALNGICLAILMILALIGAISIIKSAFAERQQPSIFFDK
jgi:hypothetical protein